MPLSGSFVVGPVLNDMTSRFPGAHFEIKTGDHGHLTRALLRGEIDMIVGLLSGPADSHLVVQEPLVALPYVLVARVGHPLAHRPSLTAADLEGYDWVAPNPNTARRSTFDQLVGSLLRATIYGRFQHHCIAYNVERGEIAPEELGGKRIGVRAYTQTTGMWVRGILQNQYGVDLDSIEWLTFEDAHVAEYRNPPNVVIAPADKTLKDMLLDGELDAAMLGDEMPDDPRLRAVIPDPKAAAAAWYAETGAISVNHLAVVRPELARNRPDVVREVFRLLKASKAAAGLSEPVDMRPYGLEALRPGLDLAIRYSVQQGLIRRELSVEELFDETTLALE
jgi:4,5-dihydroxyphthalate decarboxylase